MAQSSGPISQGTTAERQFTDVLWRDRFGDEPGVLADIDGTAYALSLPGSGDVVSVGSSTQASLATVAGFVHRIPSGSPEPITIPVAVGSSRTDIIGLRYDPSYTGLPGPVRLYRTVGSSASIPTYDSSPPGVEDLPLFAITRAVGQALSAATVLRMFPRIAPSLEIGVGSPLPANSPIGTVVQQGTTEYQRKLVTSTPTWVQTPVVTNNAGTSSVLAGSSPPAGTVLLTKTKYESITLNGNGDGTVTYPGGAFPNGVVSVHIQHISQGGPPSNDIGFVPWNVGLSSMSVRCYGPSGAPFGGTGVTATIEIKGW